MTREEKEKHLNQYLELEPEVIRLEDEICKWRCHAEKITMELSSIHSGGGNDRLQSSVEKIIALEKELLEKLDKAVDARRNVEQIICSVKNQRLRSLLRFRYIEGFKWEQVAARTGYSYVHVCRLHVSFLNSLEM